MAIRLPVSDHQSAEEQRRTYVKSNSELTAKLGKAISDLCAKHRADYETYLYDLEVSKLEGFLNGRNPNETADEYYARMLGGKESNPALIAALSGFVCRLTDHPVRPKGHDWDKIDEWKKWDKDADRKPFAVKKKKTANDIMKNDVVMQVNAIIDSFVYKIQDKMTDIVVHHQKYDFELKYGKFLIGCFNGDITVVFDDGVKFRIHVALKHNTSVLGNHYVQYPLTFHNVVRGRGEQPVAMCSEGEILDTMGIIPWKPLKTKKAWVTLGVGDIIEKQDGSIRIVIGTRAPDIKLWHPKSGEEKAVVDDIRVIHARTNVGCQRLETGRTFDMRVEMHSGQVKRVELGMNPELDKMEYGVKLDTGIRQMAFPMVLAKWAELTAPFVPEKKKIRRRW